MDSKVHLDLAGSQALGRQYVARTRLDAALQPLPLALRSSRSYLPYSASQRDENAARLAEPVVLKRSPWRCSHADLVDRAAHPACETARYSHCTSRLLGMRLAHSKRAQCQSLCSDYRESGQHRFVTPSRISERDPSDLASAPERANCLQTTGF